LGDRALSGDVGSELDLDFGHSPFLTTQ